jgi:hypothetical protein
MPIDSFAVRLIRPVGIIDAKALKTLWFIALWRGVATLTVVALIIRVMIF